MAEQQILELLKKHYTINIEAVEFLRDGGCVSYIVSGNGKKYLLKIVKHAFIDTIKQSVDIMIYLASQNFPVPQLICTADGKPYFAMNENSNESIYILFEFIEGREPELGEKMEETGELVGNLHRLMRKYNGSLTVHEKTFFIDRYIEILRRKKYPEKKVAQYIEYGNELWESIKALPRGYCHGDLHRGNLLLAPSGQLYLFDFDTSCNAFSTYDIMVICDATDYFNFKPEGFDYATRVYRQFLKGYTRYNTITVAEQETFYTFIAIRHYQLQATVMEIFGLDSVDEKYIDKQFDWLMNWRKQCKQRLL